MSITLKRSQQKGETVSMFVTSWCSGHFNKVSYLHVAMISMMASNL